MTVTICHYKSLLVTNLECHHKTYTFGDATFGDVQFLVTRALLTVTNELIVTFFAPIQCPFSCSEHSVEVSSSSKPADKEQDIMQKYKEIKLRNEALKEDTYAQYWK